MPMRGDDSSVLQEFAATMGARDPILSAFSVVPGTHRRVLSSAPNLLRPDLHLPSEGLPARRNQPFPCLR